MLSKVYRFLMFIIVSVLIVFCLASCGTFKCDMCGQEKNGKSHSASDMTVCDDCYNSLNSLID